ncbi:drug/proton antiporter YHK8 [Penicillium canariense]|uniref:Drug/proton antiporter YHK8 n=1 Tax=Penicillium canariense TaxID=189055 RepID=A0A9W9LE41_9EURO|nr:drug/proton antiporter YHK8 [Penicillium canariense]KAJ5150877.1 drug/proton antiporter YHK8 [Penicillium canariense]
MDSQRSSPERSDDGDGLEQTKSEDAAFAPIVAPTDFDEHGMPVQKERTNLSRTRSLERSWSLNDGVSPARDEYEAEEVVEAGQPDEDDEYTVGWDENDAMNPRTMSKARRWLITLIVSMGSFCVTCTSSMYTTTYGQLMSEFGCSQEVATLGLSFFIWGLGIGPLFLSPLSEFYGRRNIYIVSFSLFLIWLIPCAVAKNTETMLVSRFFNGLAGSAFLSVAGGTVGDMFNRHELALPMMLYTASPFIGPEIGPLVGGFINYYTSWRWTFYVLLIWTGVQLGFIIFFVPETYHPVLLRRKAQRLRRETGDDRWRAPIEKMQRSVAQTVLRSMHRPLVLLTMEPMCLNLCVFSAILLGILYLFFGAFQLVFNEVYGFNQWQRGLCFMGLFVGMVLAIMSDPIWRRNYMRLERNFLKATNSTNEFQPEWRLPPAILGGPLVTIGLFIFAWTTYPDVHWIAPVIGSALFGAGTVLVFSGVFTFLVDAYPDFAASALAANSFMRSSFGGIFPLFGIQMYNNLGFHWATSLLAFLTLVMTPFPYIFFRYGAQIRKKSRFARSQM